MSEPTKGAMRAAHWMHQNGRHFGCCIEDKEIADIIDRETGAAEMLEALKQAAGDLEAAALYFERGSRERKALFQSADATHDAIAKAE